MRMVLLSTFIIGIFVFESWRTSSYSVSGRTARFSKGLDRLLLFIPVLAAAVFAVLFLFILKGRFYERLCHAALVLAFWLYAARFYWFPVSFSGHWKKMHGSFLCPDFTICLAGMFGAAFSAILLTPLDRYVKAVHSVLGPASILAGAGMLAIFYAAAYLAARSPKGGRDAAEAKEAFFDGRDEDALRLSSASAEEGGAAGLYQLGLCYSGGTGVKKDEVKAYELFRKAAEMGHADAMRELYVCLLKGYGVEKDEAAGRQWLLKAAEHGSVFALADLTGCYAHGANGFDKDDPEALKWFEKAAKAGIARAQFELGKCYDEGKFVKKDEAGALKWYRKAAKHGDGDAQYTMGLLYETGRLVEKDAKQAAKWFGKAADEEEHVRAMYKYAVCLRDGIGVRQDEADAKDWFRLAAKKGDNDAKAALEQMRR